ncbi:MAG: family 16 glycosylhydrolase [Bacteroidales bacterium]|nr:family 16 glycosylhydrolase [Bacteroidales bacterium]
MLKRQFGKLNLLVVLMFVLFSCTKGNGGDEPDPEPEVIIPTSLALTITVVGADATNPNGDGSGVIRCSATAVDAVKYGFRFGDGTEVESTTGIQEYTYTPKGTNDYTVYVVAYSKTNHSITTSKSVTVYVANKLIWSDEFDTDGAPSGSKWNYDIGTGSGGWGNGELQYYTNRSANVVQRGGNLVITALKENYNNSAYTSARLKTQGIFSFLYGKVEVRAKVPSGTGVWPAIWMLGDNITTVGWPACGEIDIMEYWGYRPNEVSSALHTPSSYGNTVNHHTQSLATAEEEFHIYSMEWNESKILFYVDGNLHYTYTPSAYNDSAWPYYKNQFIILNLAIGGNSDGGYGVDDTIFPREFLVDYIRVYQ